MLKGSLFQALGSWGRAKTSEKKKTREDYSTVNTPAVTSYLVNQSLLSRNSILQELDSQVSGLKIDHSEGIAAPAIPEEGR